MLHTTQRGFVWILQLAALVAVVLLLLWLGSLVISATKSAYSWLEVAYADVVLWTTGVAVPTIARYWWALFMLPAFAPLYARKAIRRASFDSDRSVTDIPEHLDRNSPEELLRIEELTEELEMSSWDLDSAREASVEVRRTASGRPDRRFKRAASAEQFDNQAGKLRRKIRKCEKSLKSLRSAPNRRRKEWTNILAQAHEANLTWPSLPAAGAGLVSYLVCIHLGHATSITPVWVSSAAFVAVWLPLKIACHVIASSRAQRDVAGVLAGESQPRGKAVDDSPIEEEESSKLKLPG